MFPRKFCKVFKNTSSTVPPNPRRQIRRQVTQESLASVVDFSKRNAQFVNNTTFGLWEKITLKNVLQNTNERTCDYLRYIALLICLCWSVFSFPGVIRNVFLAWMFYKARNEGIATKLAEKMGREYPVGQLFCNARTAVVCLCLTFVLYIFWYYFIWYMIADLD